MLLKDILSLTLTLGWKNEKQPSGPIELDLEAGNLVLIQIHLDTNQTTAQTDNCTPNCLACLAFLKRIFCGFVRANIVFFDPKICHFKFQKKIFIGVTLFREGGVGRVKCHTYFFIS